MSFRPVRHPLALIIAGLLAAAPIGAASARASARDADDWSLCRKNDWLDFYLPDLPTNVPREGAPTDVDADRVESSDKTHYTLTGNVVMLRADQRLAADQATFDQDKNHAEAIGHVRYQDSKLLIAGDKAVADFATDKSKIEPAQYQLVDARGNGAASMVETLDAKRSHLTDASYSTCELGSDAWRLHAREIWLDQETGVGRARDMSLRVGDVPVLYLPYARFPIDDRRQSGFLYPSFGGSNAGGIDFELPYYLNLAPNYDATITPRLVGRRGLLLGGEVRYLQPNYHGELSGTWMPNDRAQDDAGSDDSRGFFRFDHVQTLSPSFYVIAKIQRASDPRYFEDFGNSLATATTSLLPSNAYLYGRGEWWNLSFGADKIQVTDPLLPASAEPYHRLPRFTTELDHEIGADWLHAGLKSELVHFDKDNGIDGKRYDFYPYVALPFERAGYYVRPEIGERYTSYDLDRGNNDSPSRSTPIVSLDAGMFFDRETEYFGHAYRQTLEPRLYYLRVPYRNQDDLPVFDTQELTFSFAGLFRPNRFSGADRQMDANQVTLAVTSRLLDDADGNERARVSLGQIRYFDPPRVELPGVPAVRRSESAFVGELGVKLSDDWSATVEHQYDPHLERTDFSAFRLQHRFSTEGVANLAYRYRRGQLEQVDVSTAIPLTDAWKLVGRYDYSIKDSRVLETFAGFEYDSCCYAVRLVGRHYVRNVEGQHANALYFEIELKGLGGFGRASEQFLRRAILGYSPEG